MPARYCWLMAIVPVLCMHQPGFTAQPGGDNHDLHYTEAGFFDIHVCNWPNRPLFFMALFSTEHFKQIKRIEVYQPDGQFLTELDLERYRILKPKNKPEKRVFIKQVDVPAEAGDGIYSARISLQNGKIYSARDYVILSEMQQASGQIPADEAVVEVPEQLSWDPVPGAVTYQVFIRDLWNEEKLLLTSELLKKPLLRLPPELLEKGGYYSWIVHARDLDAHILLGDFNHGSLNKPATFSVNP